MLILDTSENDWPQTSGLSKWPITVNKELPWSELY